MRKRLIAVWLLLALVCVPVLTGCTEETPKHPYELKSVEQVGQVPELFQQIVADNIFYGVTAFEDRLLKSETTTADEKERTVNHRIWMMDLYGEELSAYTCTSSDAYHISTLTATEDGGFLFVLGFSDRSYDQNTWASDFGYASRVIKCDRDGKVQFDTPFAGVEGAALRYCFEKDEQFYFFGIVQTPETKTRGVYSPTDIYMVLLDEHGNILKTSCIVGSDYDSLVAAEMSGDCFVLSISAQSDDGDFTGSNSNGHPVDWVFTVNDNLEITKKKKGTGRNFFDDRVGEKDGSPMYQSDALLENFDAGGVNAFIDYGDTYLIVSHNNTGEYENTPPMISSIWYYTETVYSLYEDSGKLIFRASVDSSPDYDAMVARIEQENDSATH